MDFDTDVNQYTDQEIRDLLELEVLNPEDVATVTQQLIDEHKNNSKLVQFYTDIRKRYEKKDIVVETIDAERKKGKVNPDLKSTVSRMINIDSAFRAITTNNIYDTDNFEFSLNEPINNVISLMLYSVEIPQSWYTFTSTKGNTTFQPFITAATLNNEYTMKYTYPVQQIKDGNYTSKSILQAVSEQLKICGIFNGQPSNSFLLEQDACTGKCKITITTGFDIEKIYLPDGSLFRSSKNFVSCTIGFIFHDVSLNTKIDYNLGWMLGFRLPFLILPTLFTLIEKTENVSFYSNSLIDTSGTKYIILKLDEYKPNRLNKSVVFVNSKLENTIPLPSYYNKSLSQYKTTANTVNVTATVPRQLTEKQIFTINSISESKIQDITSQRLQSPDEVDIFAKIPIKKTEWGMIGADGIYNAIDNGPGKLLVDFSGPIQLNVREYFGPVNMTSFAITLLDDKGMTLGLNGMDWSCTIIAKSIYEY